MLNIKIINKSEYEAPKYETEQSAGVDLRANIDEEVILYPMERKLIPTGIFIELPKGYDHKYVYSHFGFNLKITDMQAAVGCAQLDKIDQIVAARRANYQMLYDGLKDVPELILPVAEANSNPSWFGFLIAVKEDAGFTRNELTGYLEQNKIQTRNLFAGNLTKHPCFDEMRQTGEGYRIVGELKNTDFVMTNGFWIGVFPGMTKEMNQWMIKCIREFCISHAK
jgi:CDP-6-deoxy-D-xylo-4-hexulose-3-dehydrase